MKFSEALTAMEAGEMILMPHENPPTNLRIKDGVLHVRNHGGVWSLTARTTQWFLSRIDYEIVDTTEYFNYVDMCKHLLKGARCRRRSWGQNNAHFRLGSGIIRYDPQAPNSCSNYATLAFHDLEATDWYILEDYLENPSH